MKDYELMELQMAAVKKVLNCKSPAALRGMIDRLGRGINAPVYDLPSDSRSKRFAIIEAFGEKRRPVEWSSLLGIDRSMFWRYIEKGMTIEQIVEYRNIDYPPKK